ncbi:type II toxin-antitoxin system VapC family toxin [Kitasatospora sp. RB6PN24]|uniref:type II toxin-antitoxin system VapC family toxin n=1 Tax=Kitasatospora humi TaxID=2893891 RepID=UPI001E3DE156|nr:type II toxin-antitoxin system VapC family toxin [Kitasatospora humi]MCC9308679.1 type II toxin-antitoxin system VapC family toxin [Kitasatospora humi]
MTFLLDTNVVSETRRSRPNESVVRWLSSVQPGELYLSCLVIGELRQGVARLRWRRDQVQADRLEGWVAGLERAFADRILPADLEVAKVWGELNVPDPLPGVNGLIAATAKVHRLTLVTRNTKDYTRTGVPLLNPFEPCS